MILRVRERMRVRWVCGDVCVYREKFFMVEIATFGWRDSGMLGDDRYGKL